MTLEENWRQRFAVYRLADNHRATKEFLVTFIPFVLLWMGMIWFISVSYWLTFALLLPASALLVRLFAIQHDCGHGSFFSNSKANDWLGRFIGVLTFTPYDDWRRAHALHHASSGNLDRRGFGDIDTKTVAEFRALSRLGKLKYWVYRSPVVLFVIGPAWQFLLRHRVPTAGNSGRAVILSVVFTNLGMIAIAVAISSIIGWKAYLAIQVPMVVISGAAGIWLFYVQHQFEDTHWENGDCWDRDHAAMHGSSFYDLPQPLMWLTGNIGIHHVHHISSQIPFHKLPKVLKDYPELREVGRLTLLQSLRCIPLALWDEDSKRLVSFRTERRLMPVSAMAMPAE